MSKKPGRGGTGGGSKQRPQRPQRPANSGGKTKKPAKPAAPSHPFHSAVLAGAGGGGRKKGTRQTHHVHHGGGGKRGFNTGMGECADTCSCAAEALAMSLRLAGHEVSDRDILDLYYLTANLPDDGATIAATLAEATQSGLGGIRLASYRQVNEGGQILGINMPGPHTVFDDGTHWWSWGGRWPPSAFGDVCIEEAWELTWELPGRMI